MLAPDPDVPTVASVFGLRTTVALDGTVEGYASRFGEIDQARDMVMPGAFKATLAARGVRRIPMLFQHDPAEPVGVWLELREDSHGLYARGRLIPEVARGRELLSLIRQGAIDGLSIGFRTVQGRIDPRTRVRRLYAVELWEISIVTFPLLAGARVRAVKASSASSQACPPLSRASQVGLGRLGTIKTPISGKPEIGARAEREWGAIGGTGARVVAAEPFRRRRRPWEKAR